MEQELPIYDLYISEDTESSVEVDAVSLVDRPAIERNFLAFRADEFVEPGPTETESEFIGRCMSVLVGEEGYDQSQAAAICYSKWRDRDKMGEDFQESITDIPDDVRANARNAVKWAEENGWGACGTAVGKARASQLAKAGGAVSLDTVKRMYSYLSRHEGDLERSKSYADGCGKLMYDAWGGKSGLNWARSVLRQENRMAFAIEDEEQRIISGPMILADTPIYRRDDNGEYYVKFPRKTVQDILVKFAKKGYHTKLNVMHQSGQEVEGVTIFETWQTDKARGILPMKGYEDVPEGSAFASAKVENDAVWADVKAGKLKGFSVEGVFNYARNKPKASPEDEQMSKIVDILRRVNKGAGA
jgi:hypothetical protein